MTLKPAKDGPYADAEQKVLKDTTGLGEKGQDIVEAIESNMIANDEAATAKAAGDKEKQASAEREADRNKTRYESTSIASAKTSAPGCEVGSLKLPNG